MIGEHLITIGDHVVELRKAPAPTPDRPGLHRWWWHCSCGAFAYYWYFETDASVRGGVRHARRAG